MLDLYKKRMLEKSKDENNKNTKINDINNVNNKNLSKTDLKKLFKYKKVTEQVLDSIDESIKNHELDKSKTIFEQLYRKLSTYTNAKFRTIGELKKNDRIKQLRGDVFEVFSKLFLESKYDFTNIWLYHEVPKEVRKLLKIPKSDEGIDIIAKLNNEQWAVQCKFRKRQENFHNLIVKQDENNNRKCTYKKSKRKIFISKKELSTFQSLSLSSGPYAKRIVMTNADQVRHIGMKEKRIDETIGQNKINGLNIDDQRIILEKQNQNKSLNQSMLNSEDKIEMSNEKQFKQNSKLADLREKQNKIINSAVLKRKRNI